MAHKPVPHIGEVGNAKQCLHTSNYPTAHAHHQQKILPFVIWPQQSENLSVQKINKFYCCVQCPLLFLEQRGSMICRPVCFSHLITRSHFLTFKDEIPGNGDRETSAKTDEQMHAHTDARIWRRMNACKNVLLSNTNAGNNEYAVECLCERTR